MVMNLARETTISFHREGSRSITLDNGQSTSNPYLLMDGALGLGMPPVSLKLTPNLGGTGSTLRGKHVGHREGIFIPVLIHGESPNDVTVAENNLRSFLSPINPAPLWLRVKVQGRAQYREIQVHYTGGLEGSYSKSDYGGYWMKVGIEFGTTSALWRGEPQYIEHTVDQAVKPFLSETEPFFPVVLSDATVDAQIDITVQGDAPTYPVWTITPPGEDLRLTQVRTGLEFFFDGLITDTLTIDTEHKTLSMGTETQQALWERVPMSSRLFPLDPGRNVLELSMVGSSELSKVEMTYYPQYLGGH